MVKSGEIEIERCVMREWWRKIVGGGQKNWPSSCLGGFTWGVRKVWFSGCGEVGLLTD